MCGKDKVAWVDKKIGPDRHRGRFNPIFYENHFCKVKIFASILPTCLEAALVGLKGGLSVLSLPKIFHNQFKLCGL